jgi:Gpi18-like mannosyltransferase
LVSTYFVANTNKIGDHFTKFGKFLSKYAGRWDGNSYSYIARYGYTDKGTEKNYIVFPPVYPAIVRPIGHLINNYPLAGMLISNIFFVFACIIFYKLLRLDYTEKFSKYVVILISIFPTSFFFSVAYPEALFFLIFTLSFYLVRIDKFNESLISSALAPLTRPFGIAIYPSLFVSWVKNEKREVIQLFFLALSFVLSCSIYLS